MINRTSFSMSTEETRYFLNGIYFHAAQDGHLYAVATDGHRLSRMRTTMPQGAESMPGVIVSRKTVNTLMGLLNTERKDNAGAGSQNQGASEKTSEKSTSAEETERVNLHVSDSQIIFEFNQGCLIARLVDGNFPDDEKVIPKDNDKSFEVNPRNSAKSSKEFQPCAPSVPLV